MSNKTFNQLPTANTIDAIQDILPIYTASAIATQGINRNTLLGITGSPVGNTDTQTLSNKTLGNTNSLTIKDGNLTLQNSSSTTKQAVFSLSGITAGQTRTITLPDYNATMASLVGTETLTNKTLTSPTISSPTITNATLSTDAITGFSSSTSGTLYGISVSSSKISGSVISNTTIPYAALTTDSTWAYSTFSPAATGYSGTPTTTLARSKQIGKTVIMDISVTGTSNDTTLTFTLPVAAKSAAFYPIIVADSGTTQTSPGLLVTSAASTTATCYKTLAQGIFTNSGTKTIQGFGIVYEAN